MTQVISTGTFGVAKWVVSPNPTQGTHTTITSAIASASSGDTIFIRNGTYTENFILTPGINLSALGSDGSQNGFGNVIVNGTLTMSGAGTCSLFGIQFQTNGAYAIVVSGSASTQLNLTNCYVNCSNFTGMNFTSSVSSSFISILNCNGDIGTTGISLFTNSSAGTIFLNDTYITNSGSSSTASTSSNGLISCNFCNLLFPISTSSTSRVVMINTQIFTSLTNSVCLTLQGSSDSQLFSCVLSSGSSQCIQIDNGTVFASSLSYNTTGIIATAGTGSLISTGCLAFNVSSVSSTVTSQTCACINGIIGSSPAAGAVGEQIRATVAFNGLPLTSGIATNVTSISITAGVWDISGVIMFNGATTATGIAASISNVSSALGTAGDNYVNFPITSLTASPASLTIPSWRFLASTTTTIYLVAFMTYTLGSGACGGRISATRVG
jgi:hypothetical protein